MKEKVKTTLLWVILVSSCLGILLTQYTFLEYMKNSKYAHNTPQKVSVYERQRGY